MNTLIIISNFLLNLAKGAASFLITIKGKHIQFYLTKNGVASAPTLSAFSQLAAAATTYALSGSGIYYVNVGADLWTITITDTSA